jgi:hypothetical protein
LGKGGQRQAELHLGWNRWTVRKGEHELRTSIECAAGKHGGSKPIDARLPNLRQDIRDLVDGQCQTEPRFESERVYCRLSVTNIVKLLIEKKGYTS